MEELQWEDLPLEIINRLKNMQRLAYIGNIYPAHTYSHTKHVYAYVDTYVCVIHTLIQKGNIPKFLKKLLPDFE